jgi:hypothetical protein
MWPEDLIKPFRQRELDFDCAEMVLTQLATDKPVVFRGKGYVRQTPDDYIRIPHTSILPSSTDTAASGLQNDCCRPGIGQPPTL